MRPIIRSENLTLDDATRAYIEKRLQFAFGRFASSVRSIRVVVSDVNGPRGGVDKSCAIHFTAGRAGDYVVNAEQSTVTAAVDVAAGRAERLARRALERARGFEDDRVFASFRR